MGGETHLAAAHHAPHAPLRPSPTARRERAASHPLDTPLNVDAPLVRPYLTACEVRVGDQQARRFARMRTMHGEFAV